MGGALGGARGARSCPRRRRASGRWSAWARSSAARCARRSPAIVFALELTHDVEHAAAAADGRRSSRTRFTVLVAAALDPDREGRAPRLSPEPRVRDRSAGDPVRARGDAARGGRAAAATRRWRGGRRADAGDRARPGPAASIRWSTAAAALVGVASRSDIEAAPPDGAKRAGDGDRTRAGRRARRRAAAGRDPPHGRERGLRGCRSWTAPNRRRWSGWSR